MSGRDEAFLKEFPGVALRLDASGRVLAASDAAHELLGDGAHGGFYLVDLLTNGEDRTEFEGFLTSSTPALARALYLLLADGETHRVMCTLWRREGDIALVAMDPKLLVGDTRRLVQAEKLAGVGRMAAQVAHQLNTPLGAILLSAQALEPELADTEFATDVAILIEETRRCQRTVRRLQNFSRSPGAEDDMVNFCHLFHRVFQILGHSLEAAGVTLRFVIARGRYLVRGDPSELEHAIFALVENAMAATARGGEVRVAMRLDYEQGRMLFRVEDDGEGLPEGDLEHLFEPFFTTKPEGAGTGLGLAIARRIVRDHEGELTAGHAKGGGAAFEIRLPLSPRLLEAYRDDPKRVEIRAIPFATLQARARGEYGAGCEVVGVSSPSRREGRQ